MYNIISRRSLINLSAIFLTVFILNFKAINSAKKNCDINEIENDETCICAPGYFKSSDDNSKTRCNKECEEVYFSFFTYGTCVKATAPKENISCNLRCVMVFRLWTSIGIFCVFAAAIATLIFTIPMCVATCASCLQSKKAVKHSKRVYAEQQVQQQPNKEQQLQTLSYNPYAYWPYYGRG